MVIKTMPFVKGDKNINRGGRPKNAEPELLREALRKEGKKRGEDFWSKVAEYSFTDKSVMIAVLKKFVPDIVKSEITGADGESLIPPMIIFEAIAKKDSDVC